MSVIQAPYVSSHARYNPTVVIQFFHSGAFFTPPCVPTFGGHFYVTPTLLPEFDYMTGVGSSSVRPHTTFGMNNEFSDFLIISTTSSGP